MENNRRLGVFIAPAKETQAKRKTPRQSVITPPRVHIKDGDVEWQPLKFPIDIGFFSGTSIETSVEAWWIPKVSLTHNVSSGIVGCTHCKLQSMLSKAAVNVLNFTPFSMYSYLHYI
jgi:hypothetical protein